MTNKNRKKLAIIGTVGLPANYGGFETLTEHIVENIKDNYEITVYCSGKKYPKEVRKSHYKSARLKYLPMQANGIQSIFYDTISILHALLYADVLLILGVAGAWILPFVKLLTKKKIVISIDGIEWKRDKWSISAKMYLYWAEKMAVKYSHCDISDNESIQDYTASRYGSLSHVIEYGANHTLTVSPNQQDYEKYAFLSKRYAFKVCRIEPENNLDMILESFKDFTKYPLVIVGNWSNSDYGINLRSTYKDSPNIILLDPIYDQREIDLLRGNCYTYIHGHSAGGTNPSLVEAMYLGLPVLSYGVSYNRTTTEGKALYFSNSQELSALLHNQDKMKLHRVGASLKSIAKRRYDWNIIAKKYEFLFETAFKQKRKKPIKSFMHEYSLDVLTNHGASHLSNQTLFFEK